MNTIKSHSHVNRLLYGLQGNCSLQYCEWSLGKIESKALNLNNTFMIRLHLKIRLSINTEKIYIFNKECENRLIVSDSVQTSFYTMDSFWRGALNRHDLSGNVYELSIFF